VAAALPDAGSREREEVDDLSRSLAAAGFDLHLSREGAAWVAALRRHDSLVSSEASFATGPTALAATLAARELYLAVPSLSSLAPPRVGVAELLAAWVAELAVRRRETDARNARALDALADHLLDAPDADGGRDLQRLVPAFEARTFPRPDTLRALLRHRATSPVAQDGIVVAMIRAESRPG
jgi:hypothetical protein